MIRGDGVGAGRGKNVSFKFSFGVAAAGSGLGVSSIWEDEAVGSFSVTEFGTGEASAGVVDDGLSSESSEGCGTGNAAFGSEGCENGVSIISGSVGGKPGSGVASSEAGGRRRLKKPLAFCFSDSSGTGLMTESGDDSASGSGVNSSTGGRDSLGGGDASGSGFCSGSSGITTEGLGATAGRRKRPKKPPDWGFSGSIGIGTG